VATLQQRTPVESVRIRSEGAGLEGNLVLPDQAQGLVLFAHGSGSSRLSPRNQYVARVLNDAGLGTLLLDLLTAEEEATDVYTRQYRFDIPLLARRLVGATDWAGADARTAGLPLGYFGASTGAAAALIAAVDRPEAVRAIVSRGGRPDLAGAALAHVHAPTLLLVGGYDTPVISLNQEAYDQLPDGKEMMIVPRATHLFEEPGALEEVARLAEEWFVKYLR
jgi:pimeloyl-ACP methyl ester carboxylesterase